MSHDDAPGRGGRTSTAETPASLAGRIENGTSLALAPDYSGCSLATVRELMRRGVRELHLLGVPQLGLQADLLIGAGCVASLETAAIGLGEHGAAPAFARHYEAGTVAVRESTCPAIHAGLQAAEKGLPFMPLRGVLGSDLVDLRSDWRTIDDPWGEAGATLLVPALRPEVALFHARYADRSGNVWIGVRRELMVMAHAARRSLVTVEEIVDDDLLSDDRSAAGTIPALYIEAVAPAVNGAWPSGLRGAYDADGEWIADYAREARTEEGFRRFVEMWFGLG